MSFLRSHLMLALIILSVSVSTPVLQAQGQGGSGAPPPAGPVIGTDSTAPVPTDAGQSEERAKAQAANQDLPYDYRIGAGDTLHISVWKEPDVTSTVIVRPDGKISLALLKEIHVAGFTPVEVEQMITQGLTKLINEPDVTVVVTGIHSLKVYAVGAIKSTGPIPYTYQMTIMQAISEAGGLTDYAKKSKIYVLRRENGKEKKLPFDYDRALKGEGIQNNIQLLPGDTLVVPD